MGDLFNISGGIGGVIQLADLVVNKTWLFLKEVKNRRSEISKLSSEVASLAGVLHSLRLLSEGSTVPIRHEDILECQLLLEGLRDRLKKADTTSSRKRDQVKIFTQQLHFPYENMEMQKILEQLQRLKSTFSLALTAESITNQIDLKADVKAIKDELFRRKEIEVKIKLGEKQKEVLDFFGRVSPKENHAMSLKLRHEGTGLWVLKESRFNKWLQNCDSHIWFYGIPGAGKTVLASLIIEKVIQLCRPSEVVAFFYCDYKDTAKQDPCNILGSIASQIAVQHEKAYEILEEEHEKIHLGTNNIKHLKPEILISILKKQFCLFDFTTIIIDGLDECGDNTANVLDHLVSLAQECNLALRFAILSRDEIIIRNRMIEIDCELVSIAATSSDIRLYAASEIEQRVRNGRLLVENSSTKEIILTNLVDKAEGMFRWVACQLDYICDLTSDDEYIKALDVPAPTIFEIYERLLLRIQSRPKSTQELVRSALMWILSPICSLNIKKLCEAVTIRIGMQEKPGPAALKQIRKFCSSLIREAADGEHLEAAHFTVTEFFNSVTKESHPHIARFCLSEKEAYLEFSQICLTYLNFNDFHKPIPPFYDLSDAFRGPSFYGHAALFWIKYAENHWTDEIVFGLAKQLFKPTMSTNFKLWRNTIIRHCNYSDGLTERINYLGDSLLHWAVYLGIGQLLEWLISSGQDVNSVTALGTPLSAVMIGDDLETIILERLITVRPYSVGDLYNVKSSLCRDNIKICVETLIRNGARTEHIYECEIYGKHYNLSLHEVLLYSANLEALEIESPPIEFIDKHIAARLKDFIICIEKGHLDKTELVSRREQAVQTLRKMKRCYIAPDFQPSFDAYVEELENDIDIGYEAMNNIRKAVQNDQADVLESLLKESRGIKINEQSTIWNYNKEEDECDDDGDDDEVDYDPTNNALHLAASAGSFECIQVLMDAGANVHITTAAGNNALYLAAGSSSIGARRCVEMLVHAGLSLDTTGTEGWSVFQFAAFSGHPKTVEFLLEKGFDPYLLDNLGRSAYHLAVNNSSSDVLKLLLEHKKGGIPGIHIPDANGLKPAQSAVNRNKSVFIEELLKHIDMKELAVEGEPFLLFVARTGYYKMMDVILDSDPNLSVRGNDRSTVLHAIAENHDIARTDIYYQKKIIGDIIHKGVSMSDARNDGSLPLHLLLSSRHPVKKEIIEMMIGSNPNYVHPNGDNYLTYLLQSDRPALEKNAIALNLIKAGVNPFQKNNEGESFYYQVAKSDPNAALEIARYINDFENTDKVHWELSGMLTIHHAIIKGDLELVQTLVRKGSCFSRVTSYRKLDVGGVQFSGEILNCMHVAALYGQEHILEWIFGTSNLLIGCKTGGGNIPLHFAAFGGSKNCVEILLSKGADTKIQNGNGNNALHFAVWSGNLSVVKLLIEARAPIVANREGKNPIHLATENGYDNIAEILRKYQASTCSDSDYSMSGVDEARDVVSSGLPFRFGSVANHYNFEFASPLPFDYSMLE